MIRIYGASDDLCEVEGILFDGDAAGSGSGKALRANSDEIGCYEQMVCFVIGNAEATAGKNAEGCRVWFRYAPPKPCKEGVWAVTVMPLDENVPCPWPLRISFKDYTAVAEIDAPDGTPVSYIMVPATP